MTDEMWHHYLTIFNHESFSVLDAGLVTHDFLYENLHEMTDDEWHAYCLTRILTSH